MSHELKGAERPTEAIFDKTGREIMLGDVLKVFHFVGSRNKRHYMYKQVVGEKVCKTPPHYWFLSHLEMREGDGYHLARDGSILDDYEIVQSVDARFEDRPRFAASQEQGGSDRG